MDFYKITQRKITLPTSGNRQIALSITDNSGRIVYRDKIDTIIGIKHPGIIIGVDHEGFLWIAHHHYMHVSPVIERMDMFSKGEQVYYDNRPVVYTQIQILERAIEALRFGKKYHWLWQNCQHFVNLVAQNEKRSDTADKISDAAMITGGLLSLFGLISGDKKLRNTGLTITATGAIGKGLSKL